MSLKINMSICLYISDLKKNIDIILQRIITITISIPYFSFALRHSYHYPFLRDILIVAAYTCDL